MKIAKSWLKQYITTNFNSEKISVFLTDIGLEVEGVETYQSIKGGLEGFVVGEVMACERHPNADKLQLTQINVGSEVLPVVCGAPNVALGQKVALATIGTKIYGKNNESFEIKKSKIRGEESHGMLCSEVELGIGTDDSGIAILPQDYQPGTPLKHYIEAFTDEVFEIGLTPNRTDAMSHYGVARDLHAYLYCKEKESSFLKLERQLLNKVAEHSFQIEIENQEECPRYKLAILENIKVKESPDWLKSKLKSIGLIPINNVVDITNFILHSYGQPLHAFDAKKISGQKIIVGNCPKDSIFETLDGVERKLNGTEIMIKDAQHQPLCIAGVFGGMQSGVSSETTTIALECAYFNPVLVRKASKFHNLNTDASFRFERGVDPNFTSLAMQEAILMLQDLAEGQLTGDILEFFPKKLENNYVLLRFSKVDQVLGLKIHREKIKEILKSLEIVILNEIPDGLELSIPLYRADVTREIDVIEEILRIYGYNKVESPDKIAFSYTQINKKIQDHLENKWANTLVSNGFLEVINNSLTQLEQPENAVKLLNPLSNELLHLRTSLLEQMLDNALYNINRKASDIKFFELGKIYHKKEQFVERKQLALLLSGNNLATNWLNTSDATDFFKTKAFTYLLVGNLGLTIIEKPIIDKRFDEVLGLFVNEVCIAKLGKISPDLLKKKDINQACFYAEIELEYCFANQQNQSVLCKELPKFNKIKRDLALLVNKSLNYSEITAVVEKNKSPYVKSMKLFDVYEGKNLPENKKSYALSFELLNEEKTLDEKEITTIMNELIEKLQAELGAELRN